MRKKPSSRFYSRKKCRKRKLCLEKLYFLYLFCVLCFFVPTRKWSTSGKFLRKNGGDDETRTRDLCRDSQRPEVTSCNFTVPIATFGAPRNPPEFLLHPNCTQIAQNAFRRFPFDLYQNAVSNSISRYLFPEPKRCYPK